MISCGLYMVARLEASFRAERGAFDVATARAAQTPERGDAFKARF
jgi:hypothetical protein